MSDEVPMCQCKPRGPVHPWEPGEYCPTVRVVPQEPKPPVVRPNTEEVVKRAREEIRAAIVKREAEIHELEERLDQSRFL